MQFDRQNLEAQRFEGFLTVQELRSGGIINVPADGGAYVVLRVDDMAPTFLDSNPGGRFKGRDPTVSKPELLANWVSGAHAIYIGKGDSLRPRIRQFIQFGAGKPVGHWGGRLVWQVEGSYAFVLAWKRIDIGQEARDLESRLLEEFRRIYSRLPFANLVS